jgi:hypothetical protein
VLVVIAMLSRSGSVKRRGLLVSEIAAQIVSGTVTRGSIEAALHGWGRYQSDRRSVHSAGEKLKPDEFGFDAMP